MGTAEENPGMRHLYRVSDILTSTLLRSPECLSCFEMENSTEKCLFNKAHLSKDFSYFILECLGPNVPRTYLFFTYDLTVSISRTKNILSLLVYIDNLIELISSIYYKTRNKLIFV